MTKTTPARWDELTQAQQRKVNRYIATLLAEQTEIPLTQKPGHEVIDHRQGKGVSYQLERVKCGKKTCKCASGQLHGPYWYAYYRKGDKMICKYLGKEFVEFIPPHRVQVLP